MPDGTQISSSVSEYTVVDEVEAMLKRLGTYGNAPEVPSANSSRSVFWFAPTAQGDGDASSAENAAAGAYNNISTYCTANVQDVCIYLAGSYDINGAVGGLALSVAGVKVFGLGGSLTVVVNSNAAATAVISDTAGNCEVAGFDSNESTNTVEFYVLSGSVQGSWIHHNYLHSSMENGIHLSNSGARSIVEYNGIYLCTNDGIEVSGTCARNTIRYNEIWQVGDNAININGNDCDENMVYGNIINGSAGTTDVGINVVLGDENEIVNNWIYECVLSEQDTGSNNIFDNHCPKRNVVVPASGSPVSLSGGSAGSHVWSNWVPISPVVSAPFAVRSVNVTLIEKDEYFIQVAQSGQNGDIVSLDCRESGTVYKPTFPKPRYYPQSTQLSARLKSHLGSGNTANLRIDVEQPD